MQGITNEIKRNLDILSLVWLRYGGSAKWMESIKNKTWKRKRKKSKRSWRNIIKTTVIDALAENVIAGADDLYYSMDEIRVKKYDAQDFDYKTELLRLRESLNVIQPQTTIVAEAFGKFSEKETGSPLL